MFYSVWALHYRIFQDIVHAMWMGKRKNYGIIFAFADLTSLCFSKIFQTDFHSRQHSGQTPPMNFKGWKSIAMESHALLSPRGTKKTQVQPTRGLDTRVSHHRDDRFCRLMAFDSFSASRQANLSVHCWGERSRRGNKEDFYWEWCSWTAGAMDIKCCERPHVISQKGLHVALRGWGHFLLGSSRIVNVFRKPDSVFVFLTMDFSHSCWIRRSLDGMSWKEDLLWRYTLKFVASIKEGKKGKNTMTLRIFYPEHLKSLPMFNVTVVRDLWVSHLTHEEILSLHWLFALGFLCGVEDAIYSGVTWHPVPYFVLILIHGKSFNQRT